MIELVKELFRSYKVRKVLRSIYNINRFIDSIVISLDEKYHIMYANDKGIKLLNNKCTGHIKDILSEAGYELLTSDNPQKIKNDLEKDYIWKGNALIKKKRWKFHSSV